MNLKAKLLGFVAATGLLAGCGLLPGVGGQQVNGTFVNSQDGTYKWSTVNTGKVRLALVGVTSQGIIDYSALAEIKDPKVTQKYVMELPTSAAEGAYRVYAYCDANADSKFNSGEDIADSGSHILIYSASDRSFAWGSSTINVKKGWNGYDTSKASDSTNPYQGENYNGYDLTLRANCQ